MSVLLGENRLEDFQRKVQGCYDKTSVSSIQTHANKLVNKSIRLSYPTLISNVKCNQKNKGLLGQLVELYHFGTLPNNKQKADFYEAGLELKVTGLLNNKAKERLVLTVIDYFEIINQSFSDFLLKSAKILIIVYQYNKVQRFEDMKFLFTHLMILEKLQEKDKIIIMEDWKKIVSKIKNGKAHELASGDTLYLRADTKGKNAIANMRKQPFSDTLARQRAFCFKDSFVTQILTPNKSFQDVTSISELKRNTFEEIIENKISKYYGIPSSKLYEKFQVKPSKQNHYILAKAILGLKEDENSIELKNAGIVMKTIGYNEKGKNDQHMSFPNIDYISIDAEDEWEESKFYEQVSCKFMFILRQKTIGNDSIIKKIKFYNLNLNELNECKLVWEHTKKNIQNNIYDEFILYESNSPIDKKRQRNIVAHVRPKSSKNKKTGLYPLMKTPSGGLEQKKCFWLNKQFIQNILDE